MHGKELLQWKGANPFLPSSSPNSPTYNITVSMSEASSESHLVLKRLAHRDNMGVLSLRICNGRRQFKHTQSLCFHGYQNLYAYRWSWISWSPWTPSDVQCVSVCSHGVNTLKSQPLSLSTSRHIAHLYHYNLMFNNNYSFRTFQLIPLDCVKSCRREISSHSALPLRAAFPRVARNARPGHGHGSSVRLSVALITTWGKKIGHRGQGKKT